MADNRKRTPLFPGSVHPIRYGVYEVFGSTGHPLPYPWHRYGPEGWCKPHETPAKAASEPVADKFYQQSICGEWFWRGLAVDPEATERKRDA